jgi:alpha-galactosidase
MKIVIIGAGSRSFGRGQVADILQAQDLNRSDTVLCLVDSNPEALERMMKVARRIGEHFKSDIRLEGATDYRAALPGAKYVIIAVARKRFELWEQDFRVPLSYGFKHCLGENGGPGALFHALRSFELIIPICREVEKACPEAFVMNFTNPEARVLHAVSHLTRARAAGFCHGFHDAHRAIVRYLNQPLEQLEITSAGMNHFFCVLSVREKSTGRERLPDVLRLAAGDSAADPLFRKIAQLFGVFTIPSDNHIGEYLAFGSEFHGTKWRYGLECRKVPAEAAPSPSPVDEYAQGLRPADDPQILRPSGELTVPVIADMEFDRSRLRAAVNVINREGYIDNLPRSCVVEVPGVVNASGLHPQHVGSIPEIFAAYSRTQYSIHELLTEAYRTGSKRLLLQALLLDPVVNSITGAEKMLDEMLEMQKDYLPTFK